MADTGDLDNLSMPVGNAGVNGVKVGEPFQIALMATPSEGFVRRGHLARTDQRVETRRLPPKHRCAVYGEGIVQTTNWLRR
jgi:hypothetical protein